MGELPKSEPSEPHDGGPVEAAHYLRDAIAELAVLARIHGHDMLGYLLDMARLEAEDAALRRPPGPI